MIKPPNKTEWDTSALAADRRTYLDDGLSFTQIAARVIESATIIDTRIEPYRTAHHGEEDGRRIIFVVSVAPQTCDLLYNAPDGMRGRYWQSPEDGFAATKHLIDGLIRALMNFAQLHPPALPKKKGCAPMSADDIRASLEGLSAKVWPREWDDGGNSLWFEDQLKVRHWEQNEQDSVKGPQWRRFFKSDDLEIKGAFIGTNQTEYIPDDKRDRSRQIHRYGFT